MDSLLSSVKEKGIFSGERPSHPSHSPSYSYLQWGTSQSSQSLTVLFLSSVGSVPVIPVTHRLILIFSGERPSHPSHSPSYSYLQWGASQSSQSLTVLFLSSVGSVPVIPVTHRLILIFSGERPSHPSHSPSYSYLQWGASQSSQSLTVLFLSSVGSIPVIPVTHRLILIFSGERPSHPSHSPSYSYLQWGASQSSQSLTVLFLSSVGSVPVIPVTHRLILIFSGERHSHPSHSPSYSYLQWGASQSSQSVTVLFLSSVGSVPVIPVTHRLILIFSGERPSHPSHSPSYSYLQWGASQSSQSLTVLFLSSVGSVPVIPVTHRLILIFSGERPSHPSHSPSYSYLQWGASQSSQSLTVLFLSSVGSVPVIPVTHRLILIFSGERPSHPSHSPSYSYLQWGASQSSQSLTVLFLSSVGSVTVIPVTHRLILIFSGERPSHPSHSPSYSYLQWGASQSSQSLTVLFLSSVGSVPVIPVTHRLILIFSGERPSHPSHSPSYSYLQWGASQSSQSLTVLFLSSVGSVPVIPVTHRLILIFSGERPSHSPSYSYLQWGASQSSQSLTVLFLSSVGSVPVIPVTHRLILIFSGERPSHSPSYSYLQWGASQSSQSLTVLFLSSVGSVPVIPVTHRLILCSVNSLSIT